MPKATVLGFSESNKTMKIRFQQHQFDNGVIGYVNNSEEFAVGDVIEDFPTPTGIRRLVSEEGYSNMFEFNTLAITEVTVQKKDAAVPNIGRKSRKK